ncbi:hypothetical protein ACRRTK_024925 [Alexandromys fortis]
MWSRWCTREDLTGDLRRVTLNRPGSFGVLVSIIHHTVIFSIASLTNAKFYRDKLEKCPRFGVKLGTELEIE